METELAKITNIIVEEAKKKADSVIQEAQIQSDILINEKRQQAIKAAEEESSRHLRRLDEAKLVKKREMADAKLVANWKVLEEKHQLVNQVLEGLNKELLNPKSNTYNKMLIELITTASKVLQGGELVVTLNNEDSKKVNLKELSKKISSELGVETELVLSEDIHTGYGVVVKTKDGKIIVDNLLSSILERMESNLRQKAAKIIFS